MERRREILFVCTGNYYRSRYAEAYFNHLAFHKNLSWLAFSRGLAVDLAPPGLLSTYTELRMRKKGIDPRHTGSMPVQISGEDCDRAHMIIALKQSEHEPMAREFLPDHVKRFQFWDISDVDVTPPDFALREIEEKVVRLLGDLAAQEELAAEPAKIPAPA